MKKESMEKAQKEWITNVEFVGRVSPEQLVPLLAESDVVLGGGFGYSEKVIRAVPAKVYAGMASQKPVIAGKTMAIENFFAQHPQAVVLVDSQSPQSLAEQILNLEKNRELCEKIAKEGYEYFHTHFTLEHIGKALLEKFREI